MVDELELEAFEKHVGEPFALVQEEDDPVELELSEARAVGELSARQARELGKRVPFSLVFRGPPELDLGQAIRHLKHAELGDIHLFLVPINRTEEASLFEAVFT